MIVSFTRYIADLYAREKQFKAEAEAAGNDQEREEAARIIALIERQKIEAFNLGREMYGPK